MVKTSDGREHVIGAELLSASGSAGYNGLKKVVYGGGVAVVLGYTILTGVHATKGIMEAIIVAGKEALPNTLEETGMLLILGTLGYLFGDKTFPYINGVCQKGKAYHSAGVDAAATITEEKQHSKNLEREIRKVENEVKAQNKINKLRSSTGSA
ncbi:MAG: hypothetical protein KKF48_01560 [Nanoarchaeota archaeon]|nr:hypothetical protein [Nanoarchaeota archaeon]MBU1027708.1 hypothetical protein [Nanoarchaeota archaeon]